MTATAEPIECTDCHRPVVKSEPLWMFGNPYGPRCGKRYGLSPERRVRARRAKGAVHEQPSLLDQLGELDQGDEINEEGEEPI